MAIKLTEKQIKDGWQIVKFGDIAKEVKLTTKNPAEDGLEFYVGLDHLDPQSLRIARKGIIAEDNPSFTRRFSAGQILFGKRRCYQKKAAVAGFEGICSGDIIVMDATPKKIIPGLLPFIIQSDAFFDWAEKTSSGSLSPRTKWKSLAEFEFPLPPIERQKEVLEVLEKVEEIHSRYSILLEDSIKILNKLRDKVFSDLIGSADTIVKLKDVLSIKHGFAFSGKNISDKNTENVIVTPGNYYLFGGYNPDKNRFFEGDYPEDYRLSSGDILLNMTDLSKQCDTLGMALQIPNNETTYLHNQRLGKVVLVESNVSLRFLYHFFCSSHFRRNIISSATGTTVKHTSPKKIENEKIPFIPFHKQEEYAYALDSAEKQIYKLRWQKEHIKNIKIDSYIGGIQ